MARLSGPKRNKKRIANNAANKQARIEAEIARIKGGGRTPFSTDAAALANLTEKLKKVKATTTTKKSNLKIKGTPGSSKGAMAAQEMARNRIKEGRNTVTGELKKSKNSNGSSTTTKGTGQGNQNRKRNLSPSTTTTKTKKKRKVTTWRDLE